MGAGTDDRSRCKTVIVIHGKQLVPGSGLCQPGEQHQQTPQGGALVFEDALGFKAQEQVR